MTPKFLMGIICASLASAGLAHDFAPSPYPHGLDSYQGIHSSNSHPVSGRQMRMYRAGAALVPDSEQHVLGLIMVHEGASTGPAQPSPTVPAMTPATPREPTAIALPAKPYQKPVPVDPVREAFRLWCDLDLQKHMTEEQWELVRTHNMPRDMSCEMK